MRDDFVFKLGKQPKRTDSRTLQLARYLTSAAPAPPAAANWGAKVASWGMLGNDTVGDCAWAGQAHADMLWTSNTASAPIAITTAQVLAAYSKVTGYNPADNGPNGNPTDKGTNLLDALKFWRTTGIDGQTITAFVEVDPQNEANVKLAIDLFGCLYVGVELPDSVLPNGATNIPPWTVSPDGSQQNAPDPNNGHCVLYSAYDENGLTVGDLGADRDRLVGLPRRLLRRALRHARPELVRRRRSGPPGPRSGRPPAGPERGLVPHLHDPAVVVALGGPDRARRAGGPVRRSHSPTPPKVFSGASWIRRLPPPGARDRPVPG